jgi:acetyltransferase-like isoleucine patch superfamily enzyme
VIGAGASVVDDIEEKSIAVGVPARVIRRFN